MAGRELDALDIPDDLPSSEQLQLLLTLRAHPVRIISGPCFLAASWCESTAFHSTVSTRGFFLCLLSKGPGTGELHIPPAPGGGAVDPVALLAAAGSPAEFDALSPEAPLLGYRLSLPGAAFDPSDVAAGLQAGVSDRLALVRRKSVVMIALYCSGGYLRAPSA